MSRTMENREVVLVLIIRVDDLLVSENETVCKELFGVLNSQFSPQNLEECGT